ncbi:TPA: hypothetical protein HA265_01110 [Candidatus Woesearchaeota archaeon]|nr:hypothetical protein [Candidatus Woesearchaeota archaeon]
MSFKEHEIFLISAVAIVAIFGLTVIYFTSMDYRESLFVSQSMNQQSDDDTGGEYVGMAKRVLPKAGGVPTKSASASTSGTSSTAGGMVGPQQAITVSSDVVTTPKDEIPAKPAQLQAEIIESLQPGAYIQTGIETNGQINWNNLYFIAANPLPGEDWKSWGLAFQYGVPFDALRLLVKKYTHLASEPGIVADLQYMRSSGLDATPENRYRAPTGKRYRIITLDSVTSIQDAASHMTVFWESGVRNRCEEIYFFGVRTHCFNALSMQSAGSTYTKDDKMAEIIGPLLYLKLAGRDNLINPLLGNRRMSAFDYLRTENIRFVDASKPRVLGPSPGSVAAVLCEGEDVIAFFHWRSADLTAIGTKSNGVPTAFMCGNNDFPKEQIAASLYHEGNHKHQVTHDFNNNCVHTIAVGNYDAGFNSVWGATLYYFIDTYQNPELEFKEREHAHHFAKDLTFPKICAVPSDFMKQYPAPTS